MELRLTNPLEVRCLLLMNHAADVGAAAFVAMHTCDIVDRVLAARSTAIKTKSGQDKV